MIEDIKRFVNKHILAHMSEDTKQFGIKVLMVGAVVLVLYFVFSPYRNCVRGVAAQVSAKDDVYSHGVLIELGSDEDDGGWRDGMTRRCLENTNW